MSVSRIPLFFISMFAPLVALVAAGLAFAAIVPSDSGDTALFETFELTLEIPEVSQNRFTQFVSVKFSQGGRDFTVDGFYDGGDTWRARFMPDQEGVWSYSWSFREESANGAFVCTPSLDPENHGHVRVDQAHPRYLIHDDGSAHYWFGSAWIGGNRYGPTEKRGETNEKHVTDTEFLEYFDVLRANRHNGLLLEIQLFPLENDQLSWDLEWIHRGEFLVREMAARNINCHISIFGTWGRGRGHFFKASTSGDTQVLNAWNSNDETAKKNYLRTIVARFAGYSNVYWELGNEMGHSPNSGRGFIKQANEKYIPWIRHFDPYDLPIGLSEDDVWGADVDIEFNHQTNELPEPSNKKPRIMNELVRGGVDKLKMWKDETIRNPRARLGYRRTFWRMFTYGGCGTSEATLIRFDKAAPFNPAVLDVMGDQFRLREFLEGLPVHINEMNTDRSLVRSGPGSHRARALAGRCYVVYYLLRNPGDSEPEGTTSLRLPPGKYEAAWYNPSDGTWSESILIEAGGNSTSISHPGFREDIVLRVVESRKQG